MTGIVDPLRGVQQPGVLGGTVRGHEPGVARCALEQLLRVVVALELRNAEADALLGLERQASVAELRAEARVGAQRCRRAREDTDEVRQLAACGERTLQHRKAVLRRR